MQESPLAPIQPLGCSRAGGSPLQFVFRVLGGVRGLRV